LKPLLAFLLLLTFAGSLAAAEALDELLTALEPVAQLSGEFTQQQYDDQGVPLGESRGTFALLRPDYFVWDIAAPDSQLVIAGPEYLWHHDRDLETVTRRGVDAAGGITPLQILAGDRETIAARLQVGREGEAFLLQPVTGEDVGFSRLLLRFEGGKIAGMDVLDNLDQRLVIEFSAVNLDPALSPSDFDFTPPPDADLFYHD